MNDLFTFEDIKEAILKHEKWLLDEHDGKRLEEPGKDLSRLDLTNVNLSKSILRKTTYLEPIFLFQTYPPQIYRTRICQTQRFGTHCLKAQFC